jgi:porin
MLRKVDLPVIKCAALLLATAPVAAAPALANSEQTPWDIAMTAVVIHQTAQNADADSETTASADMIVMYSPVSVPGQWSLHIEASTSAKPGKVSSVYPEANADAGSALDGAENGRLQVSELYYTYPLAGQHSIAVGLLDVSGFFEQSRIASDETTQFLGASFSGNPTIAFPDYTLGAVYQHQFADHLVLRLALASSNGLADNPGRSYANLFTVSDDNKGVFSIASVSWQEQGWLLRAGGWVNTADNVLLAQQNEYQHNYGAYILAGYSLGHHAVNMRLGYANPQVSLGARFSSLSYRYQLGKYSAGVGIGRTFVSHDAQQAPAQDTTHFETFLRYSISPALLVTGDIQHIENSNFTQSTASDNRDVTLFGIRLTWLYD